MELHQLFLTKNACYMAGTKMVPRGIMIHSTGADNPNLRRYVQPDDGLLGVHPYTNHWNVYHPGERTSERILTCLTAISAAYAAGGACVRTP